MAVPSVTRIYKIKARDFNNAGEGSISIKKTLKAHGIKLDIVQRVAVCSYESEMNVVMHGVEGTISLTVDETGINVEVKDNGPGIGNIDLAMTEGFSTALEEHRAMGFGAGMGLPILGKLLGHSNASTTERYAHLADNPLKQAANEITAKLAAALKGNVKSNVVRSKQPADGAELKPAAKEGR